MNQIKHIVYTSDLDLHSYFPGYDGEAISALDSRSAVYIGTGIAAQNKEIVVVLLKSSNASRSAFSGMTEAYYRNLPIILVTVGRELDYSVELNDVVNSHHVVSSLKEIEGISDLILPAHIELDIQANKDDIKTSPIFECLKGVISANDYLYTSQNFSFSAIDFNCKVVNGGTKNCLEGALSNVLGASLAKKRRRYIGVVTEDEFLHDMNALGNINVNESLVYYVLCDHNNEMIGNYAKSLGFNTSSIVMDEITKEDIKKVLENKKKSLVVVHGES